MKWKKSNQPTNQPNKNWKRNIFFFHYRNSDIISSVCALNLWLKLSWSWISFRICWRAGVTWMKNGRVALLQQILLILIAGDICQQPAKCLQHGLGMVCWSINNCKVNLFSAEIPDRETPVKYLTGIKECFSRKMTRPTAQLRCLYTKAGSMGNRQGGAGNHCAAGNLWPSCHYWNLVGWILWLECDCQWLQAV